MEENSIWVEEIKRREFYQFNESIFEHFKNNKKEIFPYLLRKKGVELKIEKNDDCSMVQDVMSN